MIPIGGCPIQTIVGVDLASIMIVIFADNLMPPGRGRCGDRASEDRVAAGCWPLRFIVPRTRPSVYHVTHATSLHGSARQPPLTDRLLQAGLVTHFRRIQ